MKRQQRKVGAVHAVPLGDGTQCYALTLPEADFAFFELRTVGPSDPDALLAGPVLFRVAVHKSAWSTGRWPKVFKVDVPPALLVPQRKFIRDFIQPDQFRIYQGGTERPATREECEGLECCAVWDPEHVEDRLRDHFAGRPNKWLESLRLK